VVLTVSLSCAYLLSCLACGLYYCDGTGCGSLWGLLGMVVGSSLVAHRAMSLFSIARDVVWVHFPFLWTGAAGPLGPRELLAGTLARLRYALCLLLVDTALFEAAWWLSAEEPAGRLPEPHAQWLAAAPLRRSTLGVIYGVRWTVQTWKLELIHALAFLLSRGRVGVLDKYPGTMLATSNRQMWSRYNVPMGVMFRQCARDPVEKSLGAGRAAGQLSLFLASALFHTYISQVTFKRGGWETFVFFLLHGVIVTVESLKGARAPFYLSWPDPMKRVVAWGYQWATLHMYPGLWVREGTKVALAFPTPINDFLHPTS
jgi:hypothetical protein